MITAHDILFGLLLPGLAGAGLVYFTAGWFGCGLGLLVGYLIGHIAIDGWPDWPPPTTEQWLPCLAVAAAGAERLSHWRKNTLVRWTVHLGLLALLLGLTLRPLIQHSWQIGQSIAWITGLTIGILGLGWSVRRHSETENPMVLNAAWTMIVGATALACAMGGSQKLGQLTGALVAPLMACLVLSIWKSNINLNRGGYAVLMILWSGLLLNGYLYASVPWWAALLIGFSPAALWFSAVLPASPTWQPWQRTAILLAAVSLPLLGALIPVTIGFVRAMNAEPGMDYYYY